MRNPHAVTKEFEAALCDFTGAKYAVAVNSCTAALMLAAAWFRHGLMMPRGAIEVSLPKLTYVGVPASFVNAGYEVTWRDEDWHGEYQCHPLPLWDSARRFTFGMFRPGHMQCLSFHRTKILSDTQGGAIIHDNDAADQWLRRARFDGRADGVPVAEDTIQTPSWHCYISPDVSARLLWALHGLPKQNADLPRSDYPDLSTMKAFK